MKHFNPANTSLFPQSICRDVWDAKYRLKATNEETGEKDVIDVTVQDTWKRIAKALAAAEGDNQRPVQEERFYRALENFGFLTAGRITAGAGTERDVTLFNCYVMGRIPDSMSGIFDMLKEAALTMQAGGGIGYDFSTIRPKGALVRGVDSDASGPLPFMDVWSVMCDTIMSAGSRRGAMMGTMICDHPDIEDFITAKQDAARLRNFNISVLVTDPFMEAVRNDAAWDLVWDGEVMKTVSARAPWDKIMEGTFAYAEPGVIFIDRINKKNNLHYCEEIRATNPCGEQPLPPYGACLLGSINLPTLIQDPFTAGASFNLEELKERVATAVRMMDNVVSVSKFPLEAQRQEALNKRRIGLGYTGLGDALAMLRIPYGSPEAVAKTGEWGRAIQHAAYWASVELAKEKGPFPLFDADQYLASETVQDLDQDLQDAIREYGIRNSHLTSIAPTGTISIYAGNVSSGIEPIFAFEYNRKRRLPDGSSVEQTVRSYSVHLYREMFGQDAELPDYFVSAQTLSPSAHVAMQAAAQKWIDSSISKTINCPEDISFEDFKEVYMEAYESGCKGCTTYRPNDITGSVLSVVPEKKTEAPTGAPKETASENEGTLPVLPQRDEVMDGRTYKLKWPNSRSAYYITVNDSIDTNGGRTPFEVFINTQDVEAQAWMAALTRMVSAVFRRGGDVGFVAEELKEVFDPRGGAFHGGRYVPSLVAAIGGILERHMKETAELEPSTRVVAPDALATGEVSVVAATPQGSPCPECGEYGTMVREQGCEKCTSCGHSKCS